MANISPLDAWQSETLSTLLFASRACLVRNRVRRNIERLDDADGVAVVVSGEAPPPLAMPAPPPSDVACQTTETVVTDDAASQTLLPPLTHAASQTAVSGAVEVCCQTDQPAAKETMCQTEASQTVDMLCQTEAAAATEAMCQTECRSVACKPCQTEMIHVADVAAQTEVDAADAVERTVMHAALHDADDAMACLLARAAHETAALYRELRLRDVAEAHRASRDAMRHALAVWSAEGRRQSQQMRALLIAASQKRRRATASAMEGWRRAAMATLTTHLRQQLEEAAAQLKARDEAHLTQVAQLAAQHACKARLATALQAWRGHGACRMRIAQLCDVVAAHTWRARRAAAFSRWQRALEAARANEAQQAIDEAEHECQTAKASAAEARRAARHEASQAAAAAKAFAQREEQLREEHGMARVSTSS